MTDREHKFHPLTERRGWEWESYNPLSGDSGRVLWGYRAVQGKLIVDVYEGIYLDTDNKKLWYAYVEDENGGSLVTLFTGQRWAAADARYEAQAKFEELVDLFTDVVMAVAKDERCPS